MFMLTYVEYKCIYVGVIYTEPLLHVEYHHFIRLVGVL